MKKKKANWKEFFSITIFSIGFFFFLLAACRIWDWHASARGICPRPDIWDIIVPLLGFFVFSFIAYIIGDE